jgi:hypothetical protein
VFVVQSKGEKGEPFLEFFTNTDLSPKALESLLEELSEDEIYETDSDDAKHVISVFKIEHDGKVEDVMNEGEIMAFVEMKKEELEGKADEDDKQEEYEFYG